VDLALSKQRLKLFVCVLSLAFLVAQLGAETHAFSHIVTDPHGLPNKVQACGTCLSYAPLLGAVGNSRCVWIAEQCEAAHGAPASSIPIPCLPLLRAFQSRAPPALL
jgi:hypothetical protein